MKVWVHGCEGRMGQEIIAHLSMQRDEAVFSGGSDRGLSQSGQGLGNAKASDVILDFSSPEGTESLIRNAFSEGWQRSSLLIGTTGLSKALLNSIRDFQTRMDARILMAPNTSLGINLLLQAVMQVAGVLHGKGFDIEITETHHRRKIDSPSGTAKLIASHLEDSFDLTSVQERRGQRQENHLGISVVRGGSSYGEHTVMFLGDEEEIKISHRALSRSIFAKGAIVLAKWLVKQDPGFYSLDQVKFTESIL